MPCMYFFCTGGRHFAKGSQEQTTDFQRRHVASGNNHSSVHMLCAFSLMWIYGSVTYSVLNMHTFVFADACIGIPRQCDDQSHGKGDVVHSRPAHE